MSENKNQQENELSVEELGSVSGGVRSDIRDSFSDGSVRIDSDVKITDGTSIR